MRGPRRAARVVHAGSDAVYLDLEGACLGVLSRRAVQVPCGVRTALPTVPAVRPGAPAWVEGGRLELPGWGVVVTEVVHTSVPGLSTTAVSWAAEHLARLVGDRVRGARAQLPSEALASLAAGEPGSVMSLLGLGPGLTPLGDDVLSGWLAAAA